ncbi:unnamed protein product [Linum trigynum]|uniref:Uncharacterized protein n=1 Tax=Linum trigynum TaxID=586398 RepID=A0AAV2CL65_9ROSI
MRILSPTPPCSGYGSGDGGDGIRNLTAAAMEEGDLRISNRYSDPYVFLSSSIFYPTMVGGVAKNGSFATVEEWQSPRGVSGKPVIRGRRVAVGFLPPRVRVWVVSPTRGSLEGGERILGNRPRSTPLPTLVADAGGLASVNHVRLENGALWFKSEHIYDIQSISRGWSIVNRPYHILYGPDHTIPVLSCLVQFDPDRPLTRYDTTPNCDQV